MCGPYLRRSSSTGGTTLGQRDYAAHAAADHRRTVHGRPRPPSIARSATSQSVAGATAGGQVEQHGGGEALPRGVQRGGPHAVVGGDADHVDLGRRRAGAASRPGTRRRRRAPRSRSTRPRARPCGRPPRSGRCQRRVELGARRCRPRSAPARCRRSPAGRRSARPGRRGSPWWRPRGPTAAARRPAAAEMPAATAAPPATASEPPSQKSFCTSTMISARVIGDASSGTSGRR